MGFAGINCMVYLSDGRRIPSKDTREEVIKLLSRTSTRWPLIEFTDNLGRHRYIAAAHVVEVATIGEESSRGT